MANRDNINKLLLVDNTIHDAPLADTDAPQIGCPLELSCSSGARTAHQRFDALQNAQSNRGIKRLKLFARRACKDDSKFRHALCAWLWFRSVSSPPTAIRAVHCGGDARRKR